MIVETLFADWEGLDDLKTAFQALIDSYAARHYRLHSFFKDRGLIIAIFEPLP